MDDIKTIKDLNLTIKFWFKLNDLSRFSDLSMDKDDDLCLYSIPIRKTIIKIKSIELINYNDLLSVFCIESLIYNTIDKINLTNKSIQITQYAKSAIITEPV